MKQTFLLGALLISIGFCACKSSNDMKIYSVQKTEFKGKITESLPDDVWKEALLLNDFSQPWREEPMQETNFMALYSDHYLYLRYTVKERNLIISDTYRTKRDIVRSDRVEIFLRQDPELKKYYCLEVDPNGAVLDFSATHYRTFDDDWTWPKGHLYTKGTSLDEGYQLDMTISIESLNTLKLLKDSALEVGLYRADTDVVPDTDNPDGDFKWITWVDPKTKEPDFHVPTSFGRLQLLDK